MIGELLPTPRFSLVIPAYNEAAWLPGLLDTVDVARRQYRSGADAIEVIVGNNASTDATAAIAVARGCRVAHIEKRAIAAARNGGAALAFAGGCGGAHIEKRAIAAARNGGAALARGEILCFIDADSRIHSETFNAIEDCMLSGKVVVGATGVHPDRWSLGIFCTWLVAVPMVYAFGFDAGVVFCRRADFEEIGGYDETMLYAEDIRVMVDLKRLGKPRGQKFARAKGARAITSTRKYDKHGDWHYLTVMPRVGFWMLVDKGKYARFAQSYWYEDR